MPRLILNADDFGLTPGINHAIAELHAAGALTSATLMARGPAFDHAVAIAKANPGLGVGCHVVFTDGQPVSASETISSLLGPDSHNFRPSLSSFVRAALTNQLRRSELKTEALAQIRTLQAAGIAVTHVDTHKHTHLFPQIAGPLLEAAEQAGVPAVRNPFEQPWSLRLGHPPLLRLLSVFTTGFLRRSFLAQPAIRSGTVRTTDGTVGISATGRLNELTIEKVLDTMPEGTWELVCHPGYNDRDLDAITTRLRQTRDIERQALLSTFTPTKLSPHPPLPQLIHYGSLYEAPATGNVKT